MSHDMYDAIKRASLMFMIYECNGCACKLISCLDEENKSLITEDNEIFDCCRGEVNPWPMLGIPKIFDCWRWEILGPLLGLENPWWFVGINKSFDNFCGDVRILHDFPGRNKEKSDDLYWGIKTWEASNGETGTRIFVLLGNNSVGRVFILLGKSGAWVVCQYAYLTNHWTFSNKT